MIPDATVPTAPLKIKVNLFREHFRVPGHHKASIVQKLIDIKPER